MRLTPDRAGARQLSAILLSAWFVMGLGQAALAQETPPSEEKITVPRSEFEEMKRTIAELKQEVDALKEGRSEESDPELERRVDELLDDATGEEGGFFIPRAAALAEEEGTPTLFTGLYEKPFLYEGGTVYIGGYIDFEYQDIEGENGTFDQHRFVPFIYADVSDRIKVATELEIEHGNELSVEFAVMDYLLWDPFNFRAGIILSPVGKYNLVHDSPIQDLTTRPLVTESVIPAVSREAGLGFFGDLLPPSDDSELALSYELYFSTGFAGLDAEGDNVITQSKGLRDARAKNDNGGSDEFRDNNDDIATMGRLAVSPAAGLEAGASFHTGRYDENNDNNLTIFALDLTASGNAVTRLTNADGFLADHVLNPIEVLFEFANANISRDQFARESGVIGDMDGYYAQLNYHVFPGIHRVVERERNCHS